MESLRWSSAQLAGADACHSPELLFCRRETVSQSSFISTICQPLFSTSMMMRVRRWVPGSVRMFLLISVSRPFVSQIRLPASSIADAPRVVARCMGRRNVFPRTRTLCALVMSKFHAIGGETEPQEQIIKPFLVDAIQPAPIGWGRLTFRAACTTPTCRRVVNHGSRAKIRCHDNLGAPIRPLA